MFYNKKEFLEVMKGLSNSKILYDKDGIVILEVCTFEDCQELFGHWYEVRWCIANKECHWNSYIGEKPFSHQYFLLDFNNMYSNDSREANESFVGFTFVCGALTAAHAKNDADLMSNEQKAFRQILRDKGVYDFVNNKLATGCRGMVSTIVATIVIIALAVYAISSALGGKKEKQNNDTTVNLPKKENIIKIGIKEKQYLDKVAPDTLVYPWGKTEI